MRPSMELVIHVGFWNGQHYPCDNSHVGTIKEFAADGEHMVPAVRTVQLSNGLWACRFLLVSKNTFGGWKRVG